MRSGGTRLFPSGTLADKLARCLITTTFFPYEIAMDGESREDSGSLAGTPCPLRRASRALLRAEKVEFASPTYQPAGLGHPRRLVHCNYFYIMYLDKD
jgi:hypothetical protein